MNILSSDDLSREAISRIFEIADAMKGGQPVGTVKQRSVLALYFEKPSTRTRLSFEVAIAQLGGYAIYIDPATTQRSRGEALSDTFRIISSYCDFISCRLYKHSDLIEIAKSSSVPVINALTDLEHPTQALADVYTMREMKKKSLKGVKIAFVGDIATNTTNSLMITAAKMGINMSLIGPKECVPNAQYLAKARQYTKITVTDSPEEGLDGVDFVYTDTFVSMGEEAEAARRKKLFAGYQVNAKMLGFAKRDALVMHCLPAHRGEEISADILDGPRCIAWGQAANKLLLNKAILIYLSQQK